jgi:hypothetical protein
MSGSAERPAPEARSARSRRVTRAEDATERAAERTAARAAGPLAAPAGPQLGIGGNQTGTAATERVLPSPAVESVLAGAGRPLDPSSRTAFESRLGHDLGAVRVHDGPVAHEAARSLGALAFTAGSHVVLGAAAADSRTTFGRRVLAHELVHTVQARTEGPDGPLRRDVAVPTLVEPIPPVQKERILQTVGEIVSTVPAGGKPGEAGPEEMAAARKIAAYLVVTEDLVAERITLLLQELQEQAPALMEAAALGGRLFSALRELGVVDLAASISWYLAISLRDTVAGDFVEDPTALGIVLRTLLTLVPGLDTAADVEDIVANLLYGVLDPTKKLASIGWWFGVVLALIGLFPEFGSAIKGTVQLTVKGLGKLAQAGLDAVGARFVRMLEGPGLDAARGAIGELLVKADAWRPWVVEKFKGIVDLAIKHVTTLVGTVTGKLAEQAVKILDALRAMRNLADDMLAKAMSEVQRVLDDIRLNKKISAALETAAGSAVKHSGQAISESLLRLVSGGMDVKTIDRVRGMTDEVVTAFEKPEAFAGAMRMIIYERRKLSGLDIASEVAELEKLRATLRAATLPATLATTLTPEAAAYVLAVKRLALRRETGVVELHKIAADKVWLIRRDKTGAEISSESLDTNGGLIPDDTFMEKVIAGGEVILDYAALEITDVAGTMTGAHGALTHVLHDLVADDALKKAGFAGGAGEYRALMAEMQRVWDSVAPGQGVTDPDFAVPPDVGTAAWKAGTALWVGTYDRFRSLAQPERLWEALRPVLNLAPKEL